MSISNMSISKARGRSKAGPVSSVSKVRKRGRPQSVIPATISRRELLDDGSDQRFRTLVYDLLTVATRMNAVREHLARRMKLSGPQYSVLMAIAQFQDKGGVGVSALARLIHVSSAFVATESGKLAQLGLVQKLTNPEDRRGVLLSITRAGSALIEANSAAIRAVNDEFFGLLDRKSFDAAYSAIGLIVAGSGKATHRLRLAELDAVTAYREAAE